jgi:hypothetical protein
LRPGPGGIVLGPAGIGASLGRLLLRRLDLDIAPGKSAPHLTQLILERIDLLLDGIDPGGVLCPAGGSSHAKDCREHPQSFGSDGWHSEVFGLLSYST